jgi:hypothetical protein
MALGYWVWKQVHNKTLQHSFIDDSSWTAGKQYASCVTKHASAIMVSVLQIRKEELSAII